jgi:hypothetical protein
MEKIKNAWETRLLKMNKFSIAEYIKTIIVFAHEEHKLRLHEKHKFSPRNTSWLQKEQKLSVCEKFTSEGTIFWATKEI